MRLTLINKPWACWTAHETSVVVDLALSIFVWIYAFMIVWQSLAALYWLAYQPELAPDALAFGLSAHTSGVRRLISLVVGLPILFAASAKLAAPRAIWREKLLMAMLVIAQLMSLSRVDRLMMYGGTMYLPIVCLVFGLLMIAVLYLNRHSASQSLFNALVLSYLPFVRQRALRDDTNCP